MPLKPEASDMPGAGVTNGCEPPERGAGKGILQEQWAHSTDEPSLQPTLALVNENESYGKYMSSSYK